MSTPEGKVKTWIDQKVKEKYPNAFKYSPPASKFGRAGMADRLWFLKAGKYTSIVIAIEVKAEGNEATCLQTMTLNKLAELNVVAAIVTGKDVSHMIRIFNEIDRRLKLVKDE